MKNPPEIKKIITKDWSKIGDREKSIPEPTRKAVASDTVALTSGVPKELRDPYYAVLNSVPLKGDPTQPHPALMALFKACGDNKDYCYRVAASLANSLSPRHMEEVSKELNRIELASTREVPYRNTSIAKDFARAYLKASLLSDNKYNNFIEDALEATKNSDRIVKGKEVRGGVNIKYVDTINVNLSFSDVKKLIVPSYELISKIMTINENDNAKIEDEKKRNEIKMIDFAKIFDYNIIGALIQESNSAKKMYPTENGIIPIELLNARFRLGDDVVTQLYEEYKKVDKQFKAEKGAAKSAVQEVVPSAKETQEEVTPLRPPMRP